MTHRWPDLTGIAYGGDYNPEQWPREVWAEDARLMREAGVNFVSLGMFSWALMEPAPGEFDFDWLDEILGLMGDHGIAVDLGTPTAAPPAWFYADHPDSRVVTRNGTVISNGSRGMVSHSSPAYREACLRITTQLARRYAKHPAVVMWHVHNEYGAPVGEDYSLHSTKAFRKWLQARYGTIEALNTAWGTTFWGQRYTKWEHINAPAESASVVNSSHRLDFARFTDHQLRECFIAERDAIRAYATQPITTNFMANQYWGCDLWAWAKELDVISDDHYLVAADSHPEIHLAMAADLTRSVAGGKPWFLLEHSTSAVNWQPRNTAKRRGEMARNSLAHFARGADGLGFFQWRASRYGVEKFHSAMIPHAGTQTRVWKEVVDLGRKVSTLTQAQGATVLSEVAVLWDFESFWAEDLQWGPSTDLDHRERVRAYYERLWRDGLTVDFALPSHDLSRYRLVVVPAQYMLSASDAENLSRYVKQGGTLVVSYFSAVVDEHDAVHYGGFGAPLREVLGIRIEEYLPFLEGQQASVRWSEHPGHSGGSQLETVTEVWSEDLHLTTATSAATFLDGPAAGFPAVTRNQYGEGTAWYISTRLDGPGIQHTMRQVYVDAGITAGKLPEGVEAVTRRQDDGNTFTTVINHLDRDVTVSLGRHQWTDLITGTENTESLTVEAGAVAVLRSRAPEGIFGPEAGPHRTSDT